MNLPVFDDQIIAFMRTHADAPVASLGLIKMNPDWPRAAILNQIKARQKLRIKNPDWAIRDDLVYPDADVVEQASSAATAKFKATLVSDMISQRDDFIDLTAGSGADCATIAPLFKNGMAVEADAHTAQCLAHNLPRLRAEHVQVHHARAEDVIDTLAHTDLVLLDPQRRNQSRKGLYRLADMSPDITALWPTLKSRATHILIKSAPHLDIDSAVAELQHVHAVHIVEWNGDCKEVLLHMNESAGQRPRIHAYKIDDQGRVISTLSATQNEEACTTCPIGAPMEYLYEPGPAFMKAGLFRTIAATYGLTKLHPSTHLYTSEHKIEDFPGRVFEVTNVTAADKKFMPARANLTLRNFPGATEAMKKSLKIQDGGDAYLFACTLEDGRKAIIHTKKP